MTINTVASIISNELKKNKIKDIFMLTGYGAMYLNDAIQKAGIKYYAARNEASAPMMAAAYAKQSNKIGAVCVTAGPGATNALPGLAEAYVDSCPIIILSGQVERKHTSAKNKKINLRTYGTAEFNIIKNVKQMTKYAVTINNPYSCLYEIQKAIHICKVGRPGPVWIEIPLDVQSFKIKKISKLKKFINKSKNKKTLKKKDLKKVFNKIIISKKPLFIIGNGLKQSNSVNEFKKTFNKLKIPFFNSRFSNDLFSFKNKYNLGLCGIKGQLYSKSLLKKSDLIISLGCRLSPTLCHGDKKKLLSKKLLININNDTNEILLNSKLSNLYFNCDLKIFLKSFNKFIKNRKIKSFFEWSKHCQQIKKDKIIKAINEKNNPIDLYSFMYQVGDSTVKKHTLITDAGSNYYAGGQVWFFKNKQNEISSVTNAAMGLSVPLSIGAAVANKKKQIISITGDGSIELNIQELKTISHYNLNIKTFVINNGGYVSMQKWQDDFFFGNRLDTEEKTGAGTLNFKNIAKAFDLKYLYIKSFNQINPTFKKVFSNNKPMLIEVFTDKNQKIYGKEI